MMPSRWSRRAYGSGERARIASSSGVLRRCCASPRVPSMTDSLEVQVLYPA